MTSGSGDRSFSWNDAAPLVRSRAWLLSALSVCVRITDYYYYYFFLLWILWSRSQLAHGPHSSAMTSSQAAAATLLFLERGLTHARALSQFDTAPLSQVYELASVRVCLIGNCYDMKGGLGQ